MLLPPSFLQLQQELVYAKELLPCIALNLHLQLLEQVREREGLLQIDRYSLVVVIITIIVDVLNY